MFVTFEKLLLGLIFYKQFCLIVVCDPINFRLPRPWLPLLLPLVVTEKSQLSVAFVGSGVACLKRHGMYEEIRSGLAGSVGELDAEEEYPGSV